MCVCTVREAWYEGFEKQKHVLVEHQIEHCQYSVSFAFQAVNPCWYDTKRFDSDSQLLGTTLACPAYGEGKMPRLLTGVSASAAHHTRRNTDGSQMKPFPSNCICHSDAQPMYVRLAHIICFVYCGQHNTPILNGTFPSALADCAIQRIWHTRHALVYQ